VRGERVLSRLDIDKIVRLELERLECERVGNFADNHPFIPTVLTFVCLTFGSSIVVITLLRCARSFKAVISFSSCRARFIRLCRWFDSVDPSRALLKNLNSVGLKLPAP
jgi:hypothetical protein